MVQGGTEAAGRSSSKKRSISRRGWLKASAGVTSAALLAGCSSDNGTVGNGGGNNVTIEYYRWPHSTEKSNKAENQIVKSFNKKDNGVTVKQVKAPFGDFQTKIKTAVAGKGAPAVGWGAPTWFYDTAGKSRNRIKNEAPFVYLDDLLSDSHINQFYDAAWNSQYNQHKGIVGAPFVAGFQPGLMYVNVEAWEKAGLDDLPSDKWSLEEFSRAIEALDGQKVNGQKVNGWRAGLKDVNIQHALVEQKSRTYGKIIGHGYQNKDDDYVLTTADDAMRKGWKTWYGDPINKELTGDPFAYSYNELVQQFHNGSDAMSLHETWARSAIVDNADFEWATVPIPTRGANDYWIRSASMAQILAFRKGAGGNPDAAKKFIEYRTNAENSLKFFNASSQAVANEEAYKLMQKKGVSDYVKKTRGMEVMKNIDATFKQLKDLASRRQNRFPSIKKQTIENVLVVEQGIPAGAGGGQIPEIIGNSFQRIIKGKDAEQGLTDMEKKIKSTLEGAGHSVKSNSVGYNKPSPKY